MYNSPDLTVSACSLVSLGDDSPVLLVDRLGVGLHRSRFSVASKAIPLAPIPSGHFVVIKQLACNL